MSIVTELTNKWRDIDRPFLIHPNGNLSFNDVLGNLNKQILQIPSGSVVAVIGDFDAETISVLLTLIDLNTIIVPLTKDTKEQHEYFFEAAHVDFIIENGVLSERSHDSSNKLLQKIREINHPGLVLFTTGTTGDPKAILHDFSSFLVRYRTPRVKLKTISFLLFDHIGGINTLFHNLFNCGEIISPKDRSLEQILDSCEKYNVEVLPTTPTFLRLLLLSGFIPRKIPKALKIITYGTERMEAQTLKSLCELLPNIDFRQTYGMSELGILRVKSKKRDSLFMKIGGEGIKIRVKKNVLEIFSKNRMLGYLNSKDPFYDNGWYNTGDVVESEGEYIKIVGRTNEIINVGGLKFMSSKIEHTALDYDNIKFVKVMPKSNPISGQHVELIIQPNDLSAFDMKDFKSFLSKKLQPHMFPKRILIDDVKIMHRFKKR